MKNEEHGAGRLATARERLARLADAYEPGMYALCDGVYHVYADVPECCQALRDDLRFALSRIASLEGALDEGVLAEALERATRDCAPELARRIHVGLFNMIGRHMVHHVADVQREYALLPNVKPDSEEG